jgi:hypothetical protein
MRAAKPPAYVALPKDISNPCAMGLEGLTLEDEFDAEEVRADGQRGHGEGKAQEFPYHRAT